MTGQSLSRDRILEVALRVVDTDGLDALSMRRLAQELDVWPMSVYRYFRDKAELVEAVAEAAAPAIEPPAQHGSWRARMVELLERTRSTLEDHPSELRNQLARPLLTPNALRLSEAGLGILSEAGFDEDEAASSWRALLSYTFGFANLSGDADRADAPRRARSAVAALPEEDYPALAAAADAFATAMEGNAAFAYGLERLLDGIEAGRRL